MSLWSLNSPPNYKRDAIATPAGWTDPVTGELLVTIIGLSTFKGGLSDLVSVAFTSTDRLFGAGQTMTLVATFTEKVVVTGTPRITSVLNGNTRQFNYLSGTGTNKLLFRYTVATDETATSGQIAFTSPIDLNSGTIKDFDDAGAGTGATGTVVLSPTSSIKSVTVGGSGTGYTNGDALIFTGGGGTGAAGTIAVTTGNITGVTISNAGSGYTSAPTITFTTPGGSGNTLTIVLQKTVASVTVTAGGTNYHSAPTVAFSGGAGTGAAATAVVSRGVVTGVTITNAGSGYTSVPTVAFTPLVANSPLVYTTTGIVTGASVNGVAPTFTVAYTGADVAKTTGEVITLTATVSKVVTVTGTPRIPMTIDGETKYATYASGSGTTSLVFTYTVVEADHAEATEFLVVSPAQLNSGTIKDAWDNAATLTFTPPTVTTVTVNAA